MKLKLLCNEENKKKFIDAIKNGELEITNEDANLVVIEPGYQKESILGKLGNDYVILNPEDIIYIEGLGNDVICYTDDKDYFIKEKLFELESIFYNKGFIRISKSHIINKKYINTIRPTINMKYLVRMKNNIKLEVTRTYYYKFKEFIGF